MAGQLKFFAFLLLTTLHVVTLVSGGVPLQNKGQRGGVSRLLHGHDGENLDGRHFKPALPLETRFRLPNDTIEPEEYNLEVTTILNSSPGDQWAPWTAPGKVTILFHVIKDTNLIKIAMRQHIVNLTGDNPITVTKKSDNSQIEVDPTSDFEADTGFYVIRLKDMLLRGEKYDLHMEYIADITDLKTGLYRAPYTDDLGQQRWMATTQFETIGFRFMAPGFDEPSFKAIFTISIGRPSDHISLSNSAISELAVEDPDNLPPGFVWDKYLPTVKMSTYLIALTVAQYSSEQADETLFPGKPVQIYGPTHLIANGGGKLGAEVSAKILKLYEEVFEHTYAMHKMDSLAVPRNYFLFGAMENWGLNIYRDNLILYYEGESVEYQRAQIISVFAHELAHQWFGNVVTCKFWDQMWLNEGFASYISYIGMDGVAPEYNALDVIMFESVAPAQIFDAGPYSHPIINGGTPEEYEELEAFDTITYDKGASLIRMMEGFLGKDTLLRGLIQYLELMKFSSAEQDDLFAVLNQVAHAEGKLPEDMDMKTIMDTHTLQKGIPLVRVSRASDKTIYISQERFMNVNVRKDRDLDPNDLWEVPISVMTAADPTVHPEPQLWLHKDTILTAHTVDDATQWVIVNPGGFGYYRTLYDVPLTTLIQDQLLGDHTVIDYLTKSKLIDDYFQFAEQGYVSLETALGMTTFLGRNVTQKDFVAWRIATPYFAPLFNLLSGTTALPHFKSYLVNKVSKTLDTLHWDEHPDEPHGSTVVLRPELLEWACALDHPYCISRATNYLQQWRDNVANGDPTNPVPINVRIGVYCPAVAEGPTENFDFLLDQYKSETNVDQRTLLINALTCSQSIEKLLWLIINSIDPEEIRPDNLRNVIQNVGLNLAGRHLAVSFVHENWQALVDYTATDPQTILTTIISTSVASFTAFQTTQEDYDNLSNLMADIEEKNPAHFAYIKNSLLASLNTIQDNIKWSQDHLASVSQWLESHSP